MLNRGIFKTEALKILCIFDIACNIAGEATTVNQTIISSAYDLLIRNLSDCDSYAQTQIAVFDTMGYNTMIIANKTHADGYVQLGGGFYALTGGVTKKIDKTPTSATLPKDNYFMVAPNYS